MRSYFLRLKTSLAAVFCTRCSFLMGFSGSPFIKLLQLSIWLVINACIIVHVASWLRNIRSLLRLWRWYLAFWQAFVICISIFKLESKTTPRFGTDVTGVIWSSPTWMNGMFTRSSCCLLPTIKNSVLLSFTISMLEIIQLLGSATQFSMAVTEAVWFVEGMGLNDR